MFTPLAGGLGFWAISPNPQLPAGVAVFSGLRRELRGWPL